MFPLLEVAFRLSNVFADLEALVKEFDQFLVDRVDFVPKLRQRLAGNLASIAAVGSIAFVLHHQTLSYCTLLLVLPRQSSEGKVASSSMDADARYQP